MARRLNSIPGTRQDTADAAVRRSDSVFYASHNWHPFFLHGTKTLAYELWEDLGFRAPDNVIVPCGAGSNVLGCEIGFAELLRAGEIDSMPRIFAAQPAHCGPIAAAFIAGSDAAVAAEIKPTIAEGTAIAHPIRLREVLGTLRETRGGAVMLTEEEIGAATLDLARIGHLCRADRGTGCGGVWEVAGDRDGDGGSDDGAGADRQRAEGNTAHCGAAGSGAVMPGHSLPLPLREGVGGRELPMALGRCLCIPLPLPPPARGGGKPGVTE